jgi:hypothetical protein
VGIFHAWGVNPFVETATNRFSTFSIEVDTASYVVRMDGAVAVHEVPTAGGVNDGLWAWLWPNLAFNVYRYGLMVEHMQPVGQGRTRLDYLYFYDPATADMDAVLAASDTLTLEDKVICEAVQKGLITGEERAQLEELRRLTWDAISVDDFDHEDLVAASLYRGAKSGDTRRAA